jgi:hypothetical protein
MLFFNIDLHISIIADMKKIFTDLGHKVDDKSLSDHTWVFNRKKDSVPMLDNGRWMSLSPEDMANEFYITYKDQLKDYDCFITTYPPTFSLLYKYFDKPIIINNPIRYEWPFSFHKKYWEEFNSYLRKGYDEKRIILIANNLYDKYYMELFIERPILFIPSICDYYPNGEYVDNNNKFLYYSRDKIFEINNPNIVHKNDILKTHTHYDLLNFKGITHIPYQISYMSVFEQYNYNIPLIFPTREFLLDIYKTNKYNVLKEVSWNNYFSQEPRSRIPCNNRFDPNNYECLDSVSHWLQYADFYDREWMPHISYFNSFDELNNMLNSLDTKTISKNMQEFNKTKKEKVYSMWRSVLEQLK